MTKEVGMMDYAKNDMTMIASSINLLAAAWLIFAPAILQYTSGMAKANDIAIGIVIGAIALLRLAFPAQRALSMISWVSVVLGVWLIVSPYVLRYASHTTAQWNDIILGIIIAFFAYINTGVSLQNTSSETA